VKKRVEKEVKEGRKKRWEKVEKEVRKGRKKGRKR
jgi:hypothetical protein